MSASEANRNGRRNSQIFQLAKTMAPILHCTDMSPPVRAVLLTAHALDLELEIKQVNLMAKEHLTPEFLEMNPQHTVPTLEDDGYFLWDSHAIAAYLVNRYGEDDSLYPQDPQLRGTIDQRLHFDGSVLFPRMSAIVTSILFGDEKSVSEEQQSRILEAFGFLEAFLDGHEWMVGDNITIADLCLLSSVSSINHVVPVDAEEFPKLAAWLERCTELPYYEQANGVGLEKLVAVFKIKMES